METDPLPGCNYLQNYLTIRFGSSKRALFEVEITLMYFLKIHLNLLRVLKSDIQYIHAAIYAGVFCSGVNFCLLILGTKSEVAKVIMPNQR